MLYLFCELDCLYRRTITYLFVAGCECYIRLTFVAGSRILPYYSIQFFGYNYKGKPASSFSTQTSCIIKSKFNFNNSKKDCYLKDSVACHRKLFDIFRFWFTIFLHISTGSRWSDQSISSPHLPQSENSMMFFSRSSWFLLQFDWCHRDLKGDLQRSQPLYGRPD